LPKLGEARVVAESLRKKRIDVSIIKLPIGGVKVWREKS